MKSLIEQAYLADQKLRDYYPFKQLSNFQKDKIFTNNITIKSLFDGFVNSKDPNLFPSHSLLDNLNFGL